MARILVVDDRETDRQFLTTLLAYHGHAAVDAGGAEEALALIDSHRPDLVITDVVMPRVDGFDFARRLKALPGLSQIPVLFYTASYHEREVRSLAAQCGVAGVLTKPSDPRQLLAQVHAALAPSPSPVGVSAAALDAAVRDRDAGERRMASLLDLAQRFAAAREPEALLQDICHVARDLTLARYAALGIGSDDGSGLRELYASGLSASAVADIRVAGRVDEDTFLVVPVGAAGRVYGWLGIGEKLGAAGFTEADERAARALAAQGGVAYENALLVAELTARAERLRAHEERTEFALAAARVGVWDREAAADPSTLSNTMTAFLGVCGDDPIHPDDRAIVRDAVADALRENGEFSVEFRASGPDGVARWLQSRGRTAPDEEGRPARRLLGVTIDITDRRSLEVQLRQAQKMEAIGQLAGGVAHDFNNLLTAILGYTRFLLEDVTVPAQRHDLEQIVKAANRAAALTRQLLAFSRRQVVETAIVDLNAIIEEMASMLRPVIGEHITLTTEPAPDLHPVRADRGYLEQVIMNLVVNARDAMPHGGQVVLRTANAVVSGTAYARLSVTDSGCGMSEDTKARLFEPFFTTKGRAKGTGLGLATVYGIVTQTGGHVTVTSELNRGSTFDVYLPKSSGVVTPLTPALVVHRPRGGHERILLVEDEADVRELTRLMLQRAGYDVVEAANPAEAQAVFAASARRIDLLVTDVVMPGGTGPDLFAQLGAQDPELRALFMSGYTDTAVLDLSAVEREAAFLAKPFAADTLVQKVRALLDH